MSQRPYPFEALRPKIDYNELVWTLLLNIANSLNSMGFESENRVTRDKNTLGVIVGQQGIGKSYHALRLAKELDPEFTVESVVFEPKDYLNLVEKDSPGRIRIWDEPGLGLGHRDFMSNMNKVIIGELQSFRFKKQDTFFCLPIGSLL